jgi:hypothetical protein
MIKKLLPLEERLEQAIEQLALMEVCILLKKNFLFNLGKDSIRKK